MTTTTDWDSLVPFLEGRKHRLRTDSFVSAEIMIEQMSRENSELLVQVRVPAFSREAQKLLFHFSDVKSMVDGLGLAQPSVEFEVLPTEKILPEEPLPERDEEQCLSCTTLIELRVGWRCPLCEAYLETYFSLYEQGQWILKIPHLRSFVHTLECSQKEFFLVYSFPVLTVKALLEQLD